MSRLPRAKITRGIDIVDRDAIGAPEKSCGQRAAQRDSGFENNRETPAKIWPAVETDETERHSQCAAIEQQNTFLPVPRPCWKEPAILAPPSDISVIVQMLSVRTEAGSLYVAIKTSTGASRRGEFCAASASADLFLVRDRKKQIKIELKLAMLSNIKNVQAQACCTKLCPLGIPKVACHQR